MNKNQKYSPLIFLIFSTSLFLFPNYKNKHIKCVNQNKYAMPVNINLMILNTDVCPLPLKSLSFDYKPSSSLRRVNLLSIFTRSVPDADLHNYSTLGLVYRPQVTDPFLCRGTGPLQRAVVIRNLQPRLFLPPSHYGVGLGFRVCRDWLPTYPLP